MPSPFVTGSLLGLLFCATPAAHTGTPPSDAAPKPVLLVFITVDQLREDYLEKWRSQFTGGLKRLLDRAAFFTNAHQDYAITETAPGHASTMSGRFPRSTGITRNLAGVNDSTSPLIGSTDPGASPFRFRGTTLTDWLVAADAHTRVLSVSAKDRGAILPIGRSKQAVYWYTSNGLFTTSRWYADSLPGWVQAFDARRAPQQFAGRVWDLLLPAKAYPEPDSVPVEGAGGSFLFPHGLPADSAKAAFLLRGTPFMDEVTVAFALDGVTALELGKGPGTDLLAVSLSATDYIGHAYGPDSRELHDQILRLDRTLGVFFDSLYKLRDSAGVIFALTADHGVAPYPELSVMRFTPPPGRVDVIPALAAARAALAGGQADTAAATLESGALFIEPHARGVTPALIEAAADSFVRVAHGIAGVLRAERFKALAGQDPGKDPIARRWVQMFPPDVPVQAVVTLTPGSYWANYPVAMHGTPHDYDTHVPLLFVGAPFKPGRYPQFVRTVDIAPTLAQVLGVTPSEPLDGRPLTGAIK